MRVLKRGTKEFDEYAEKSSGMSPYDREVFRIESGVSRADDDALIESMSDEARRNFLEQPRNRSS